MNFFDIVHEAHKHRLLGEKVDVFVNGRHVASGKLEFIGKNALGVLTATIDRTPITFDERGSISLRPLGLWDKIR